MAMMNGYEWVLYRKDGSLVGVNVEHESADYRIYTSENDYGSHWHSAISLPSASLSMAWYSINEGTEQTISMERCLVLGTVLSGDPR